MEKQSKCRSRLDAVNVFNVQIFSFQHKPIVHGLLSMKFAPFKIQFSNG